MARELDRRGHEVVIACTRRFGPLIAEIPTSIRVVRLPWWAPAVDIGAGRSIIISGETKSEIAFAALWKSFGHPTPLAEIEAKRGPVRADRRKVGR